MTGRREYAVDSAPSDGTGVKVTATAVECVDAVSEAHGFRVRWCERDWNIDPFHATGRVIPLDRADGSATATRSSSAPSEPQTCRTTSRCGDCSSRSGGSSATGVRPVCELRPMRALPGAAGTILGATWTSSLCERTSRASTRRSAGAMAHYGCSAPRRPRPHPVGERCAWKGRSDC
jgi:hypothetical protein